MFRAQKKGVSQAFHRGTAALFSLLTPEQIRRLSALEADSEVADRLGELAEQADDGELTPIEREEYEAYIEANNLLAVLQAEARFHLGECEP